MYRLARKQIRKSNVALDVNISTELKEEGIAREVIFNRIQT
jgi:hypothetical protein